MYHVRIRCSNRITLEVPGSCEIIVLPKAPYDFIIKNGKVAMDAVRNSYRHKGVRQESSFDPIHSWGTASEDKGYVSDLARQSTLRGHGMSNFSVRISTVMYLLDSPVEIRENSTMETEFCEFSRRSFRDLRTYARVQCDYCHFGQHTRWDFTAAPRLFAKRWGANGVRCRRSEIYEITNVDCSRLNMNWDESFIKPFVKIPIFLVICGTNIVISCPSCQERVPLHE